MADLSSVAASKPSRRSFLRLGALAAGAALLPGAGLLTPPKAEAQQAVTTATTVSDADAYTLFKYRVYDRVFEALKNRDYDNNVALHNIFNDAKTDKDQALALVLGSLSGSTVINEAAQSALKFAYVEQDDYEGRREIAYADLDNAVHEYADKRVPYNGSNVAYTQMIALAANDLLDGAKRHNMTFRDYMAEVYIPHKFGNSDNLSIKIQQTAKAFGLGRPSNTTLAAFVRQP